MRLRASAAAITLLVLAIAAPTLAPASRHHLKAAAPGDTFDVAISVSVSRKTVPFGGTLREVMKVTNRGSVAVPTADAPSLVFGQELNRPGQPNYPGKAKYAFVRSPGGRCSAGTFGSTKLQTFACDTVRLEPGETQKVDIKIKDIESPLLLDANGFYGASGREYDDVRSNDEAPTIIRVRRSN